MQEGQRVALVHDFLVDVRGAERVFLALCDLFPAAELFTAVYDERGTEGRFAHRRVHTSFLQALRPSSRTFRSLLPLYPSAMESLDLRGYDLVLSSSSAWAHGVIPAEGAVHVCYCHNPFRYAWNAREVPRPGEVVPGALVRGEVARPQLPRAVVDAQHVRRARRDGRGRRHPDDVGAADERRQRRAARDRRGAEQGAAAEPVADHAHSRRNRGDRCATRNEGHPLVVGEAVGQRLEQRARVALHAAPGEQSARVDTHPHRLRTV